MPLNLNPLPGSSTVFITGVPRSGTSLTAGLVKMAGFHMGDTVPGNKNNPRGFFERADIRSGIIKPYLESLGADPNGNDPLPSPHGNYHWIPNLERRFYDAMGRKEDVAFKEPKLLLIWRQWLAWFPNAKWVLTHRDDEEILDSVERTPFMRAFAVRDEWRPWLAHYKGELNSLAAFLRPRAFVFEPHRALDGDAGHIRALSDFLGKEIPERDAGEFLDRRLWKRAKY